MKLTRIRSTWIAAALLIVAAPAIADDQAADYLRDVKPVLRERCYACHGALKQEAGLRLDTAARIWRGGDSGAVIEAGRPADSELLARISESDADLRMPPEGHPLTPEQIAAIARWIESGAAKPDNETGEADPREHWAFRPPERAELPAADGPNTQNPIDHFIEAARRERKLQPVDSVDKSLLLRRVYLDLIGLPPTPEQLHAFLADESPDAFERVVAALLESEHYGERWGRHWMDVWRYSDWFGLGAQLRYSQKHIWHWRDWIIESLNADKGYDTMIVEMLAADEIAPTDADRLRATGFLARNYFLFNRTTWLDKTIEHTGKAFLGLTMNCTKCHDHKYDPISQLDYYRFRAFFEPHQVRLDSVPGQIDLEKDGLPRVFDAHPDTPTYLHIRGNEKDPDKELLIEPAVPALLAFDELRIQPVALPLEAHRPQLREFVRDDHLAAAGQQIKAARDSLAALQQQLASTSKPPPAAAASGELFLRDEFDAEQDAEWERGPGDWAYTAGKLVQSATGASRNHFRTRREPPRDFTAVVKFRTTGGEMWKSVGLAFDVSGEREKLVYMSAYSGGSKVQVSYNTGGGAQYPLPGKQDRPVKLNEWYELEIAVRDQLINISIDGKFALAFQLPIQREPGHIDLIAFDAAVEYDEVEIRALPTAVPLVTAGTPAAKAMSPAELQVAVQVAERNLAAAEQKPAVIEAAFAADRALAMTAPDDNADELMAAAASAARQHELALAELALAQAEQKLAAADEKTKAQANQELAAAVKKVEAARAAIDKPGQAYPSLNASLKALEGPAESDASRRSPYPPTSTGRRTALARWITDHRNPLTARVAVNHIWLRHFGQPLAEPMNDFGRRCEPPPLQELLDWLAVDLMDHQWSMKRLHRLIVTSQAYRLSTSTRNADPDTVQADPENQFYWRRRPVRMESQIVRDSVLHLGGRLDLTLGGPTIAPNNEQANRRSLYFTHSRDDRNLFLSMFDDADIIRCYRRQESVIPQQALTLANSRLSLEMARELARQWQPEPASDATAAASPWQPAFVSEMFETVLCRLPTAAEADACLQTLKQLAEALADHPERDQRARAAIVHALFNHNDFVTIR